MLPREDPGGPVRWLGIGPCYVFHILNAHEQDGRIILTVVRHPDLWRGGTADGRAAVLWRWTIDLAAGKVTEEQLDDRPCEFPRIDERLAGLDARYGYAVTAPHQAARPGTGTLLRYDLHAASISQHDVYDAAADTSDLVILDADDLAARPAATIRLPRRVPYGFHGNWLPDPA